MFKQLSAPFGSTLITCNPSVGILILNLFASKSCFNSILQDHVDHMTDLYRLNIGIFTEIGVRDSLYQVSQAVKYQPNRDDKNAMPKLKIQHQLFKKSAFFVTFL